MAQARRRFSLQTLGGLSVFADGANVSGAAQQRKTLALLALLAASGRRGMSRDKVLAYLWPESDIEHGRALLKQACYALRRDLEEPELFLGATELRLNPDIIASDVDAFEVAFAQREYSRAVELYVGPFLDGFHLSDAPEFERWVDTERVQLRQRARDALESLATAAERMGDRRALLEHRHRLFALEPLNSRIALVLMQALAEDGDRAGALAVARTHETMLREGLDTGPDPAVSSLAERLRVESDAKAVAPPVRDRSDANVVARPPTSISDRAKHAWVPQGRARWIAPVAVLLATVGLLIGARILGAVRHRAATVVVLPFVNFGDPKEEYFADGMSEEITTRLGTSDRLRVIAATSARAFKYARKDVRAIGKDLHADYVLEGGIRIEKSADGSARVRVTPQLARTSDGTQLWARIYDEPYDGIIKVQSDIAQKVVQTLDVTLPESQRRDMQAIPTQNMDAYEYYLRGKEYERRGGEERNQRTALQMFEKATELDSTFALAYAMLSRMHSRMYLFHFDRSAERLAQAKRSVDRAFQLAPDLPEAHHSLGSYYWLGFADYNRALQELSMAAASKPNDAEIIGTRGTIHQRQGKLREAIADFQLVQQLDPTSPANANGQAQTYMMMHDYARANAQYDRAIALLPDMVPAHFGKTMVALRAEASTQKARAMLDQAAIKGIGDVPYLVWARVWVEVFDRQYDRAIDVLSSKYPDVFEDQNRFVPRTLRYAEVYDFMKRRDLVKAYYDSARVFLLAKVHEHPEDPRLRSALGVALAGLGRKDEAIREGKKGVALLPISVDAFRGYHFEWDLARIYTMVGEYDTAISRLEYLVSIPGWLTPAWLRADPTWDALRSYPRFQRIVAQR